MFLLIILLASGALGIEHGHVINNYHVRVEKGVLTKVTATDKSSGILDLSGLCIHKIDVNCFEGLKGLKKLILKIDTTDEIRSQDQLPPLVFRGLSELETLRFVNTEIHDLRWVFWGLSSLRLLDLNTSSFHLEDGSFFGLNRNVIINSSPGTQKRMKAKHFDEPFPFVSVQITDGIVRSVDLLNNRRNTSTYSSGITKNIPLRYETLALDSMGIKGFAEGWYRIENAPVRALTLMRNDIDHLTSGMFNNLPKYLSEVYISWNKITRIESGIISNPYLRTLEFNGNPLISIDPYAFSDTQLTKISLSFDFMKTLPTSLQNLNFAKLEGNYVISHE